MKTWMAVCFAALFMGAAAFAQTQPAGAPELALVNNVVTGALGFFVGLLVAVVGVYAFVVKRDNRGLVLIILAVLFTLAPGVYNGVRQVVCPLAKTLSSSAVCD